ncbi:MAG TPA: hypothetical protein VJ548_05830 [Azospira sp.]|nr:hypothetical protein [Azospira sp.]
MFSYRSLSRLLCLLAVFFLSACSHLPVPGGTDESRVVLDAIAQAQRVSQASEGEQRRELAAAQQAYNRDKGSASRLRLGMLLALPLANLGDESRALSLLEPLAGNSGPVGQFAGLLAAQVNERLRQERKGQQWKEQLDQLKTIERQLIERGKGGR